NKVIRDVHIQKGAIQCVCSRPEILYRLKTAVAVYVCDSYAVPRPKALLGHEHFSRILKAIAFVRENVDTHYQTFYISAAGSDSSVMERIKSEIASATGLIEAEQGDMLLRIRRSKNGWDVLTRLTNRPLATRAWRVCNMEGALNAPVAHAMIKLSHPKSDDRFLNIACGSGTLLIERCAYDKVRWLAGCDINADALNCASENIAQAGYNHQVALFQADATHMPISDNHIDVICADLPFGQLVGSHAENVRSYPLIFAEIQRLLAPNGRAIIITHEIKLMQSLMPKFKLALKNQYQIVQRGLHPCIYIFKKGF
ncbi:MAG: methyltransferase domain-containing protein, partial [Anaerolineae bacterium]|nr:methyltransferase domain-containing protein [Anaerolineae bacterium]